jgi:predicted metal-dependent enzyme (double-stranded beta helix superfamily)
MIQRHQRQDVRTMEKELAVLQRLSGASHSLDQYLHTAQQALGELVASPNLLARVQLERRPGGLARNLICGDEHLSIWAMVWAPGTATPIHDHHCSCCFAVLAGSLREVWFQAIDASRAVRTAEHDRLPGFIAAMMPNGPNIHQMINASNEEAISIHVYGYDHRTHNSSIHREYQRIEN